MFTLGFLDMDLDKKLEIREQAIYINSIVVNFFSAKGSCYTYSQKIDKAYAFFKKQYNKDLNDDEKTIFSLYIIFPDDDYFESLIVKYNKDFEKVASFYNINARIVKMRHLLQKNIYKEETETYKKQ